MDGEDVVRLADEQAALRRVATLVARGTRPDGEPTMKRDERKSCRRLPCCLCSREDERSDYAASEMSEWTGSALACVSTPCEAAWA